MAHSLPPPTLAPRAQGDDTDMSLAVSNILHVVRPFIYTGICGQDQCNACRNPQTAVRPRLLEDQVSVQPGRAERCFDGVVSLLYCRRKVMLHTILS